MKKLLILIPALLIQVLIYGQDKLMTKTGHISFYSHTVAEDITANNYSVISTLNPSTGEMVFSAPMQAFEFEKSLMQKHFNSPKFLDTKQFPKAKFKGKIEDLGNIDLSKDGTYDVVVSGDLTMHGVTNPVKEKGTLKIEGGKIVGTSKFNITLADYKVAFEKGKPSSNIAKVVETTINVEYPRG